MADSFLSHLDLALLRASLGCCCFYPCWRIRQLADGLQCMALACVTWHHPELKEIAVLIPSFVCE